jgi:glycosyltransferase involved in cell wall biosynthesis
MAAAIVKLLSDEPMRRAMGAAGEARVQEHFSAERMVQDTLAVYRRVAMHPHVEV